MDQSAAMAAGRARSETRSPATGSPCARPSATPETRGRSPRSASSERKTRDGSLRSSPLPASPNRLPCPPWTPLWTRRRRGPDWMPITLKTGSLFHSYSQIRNSGALPLPRYCAALRLASAGGPSAGPPPRRPNVRPEGIIFAASLIDEPPRYLVWVGYA
jgi:hypothetical protein